MEQTPQWDSWQAFAASGGWAGLADRRIEPVGQGWFQVLSGEAVVARVRPLDTEPTPNSPGFSEWLASVDC